MRRRCSVVLLLLAVAAPAAGQSVLELYGLGMWLPPNDVMGQGAGDIRSLPLGPGQVLATSVASWYALPTTQLRATLGTRLTSSEDGQERSRAGLQQVHFLAHLDNRTALGVVLHPLTRSQMILIDTNSYLILAADTLRYAKIRRLEGGVSSLKLGLSRQLSESTAIGLSLGIIFGSILEADTLGFTERGDRTDVLNWVPALEPFLASERSTSFLGRTVGFSIQTGAWPRSRSMVGLQIDWPLAVTAKVSTRYHQLPAYSNTRQKGLHLPSTISASYGLDVTSRQRLLAEWTLQQEDTTGNNRLIFGRQLERVSAVKLVWAFSPAGPAAPQPGRFGYRVGFIYRQYYLSDLKNKPLSEIGITLGLGVQSLRFGYGLDLAMQVGQRDTDILPGTKKETFFRFSIGARTGELWFARPKKNW